jgi:hypothetical protein
LHISIKISTFAAHIDYRIEKLQVHITTSKHSAIFRNDSRNGGIEIRQ